MTAIERLREYLHELGLAYEVICHPNAEPLTKERTVEDARTAKQRLDAAHAEMIRKFYNDNQ